MSAISRDPSEAEPAHPGAGSAAGVGGLLAALSESLGEIERSLEQAGTGPREATARARAQLAQLAQILAGQEEVQSLSADIQRNVEREKAALARELHDQLGGILTPAKMDLSWLEARLAQDPEYGARMSRLAALIDQGIDLKRRIIEKLRPSLLDHLGLGSALHWYMEEVCRKAGVEPHLDVGPELGRLPPDLEIGIYRLVQEGVTNVVKHARAGHVDVTIERTAAGVHATISDDGIGIEDLPGARKLTRGLAGMSHRVRSLNGTLEVRSHPGKGTRIAIFVPLAR